MMQKQPLLVLLLGLVLGGLAVYWWNPRGEGPVPGAGKLKAPMPELGASALGRIMPWDGIVTVGIPLSDRLEKIRVQEGDLVKPRDILADLTSQAERQLQVDVLDKQIKEAEAKLIDIEHNGNLQLELERLNLKQAEAMEPLDLKIQTLKVEILSKQAAQAEVAANRVKSLTSVAKQDMEQQELLAQQAQAELGAAEEMLQKLKLRNQDGTRLAKTKLELTKASIQRSRAEVPLLSLQQQRRLALKQLENTQVRALSAGKILEIVAHPGELVGGPQPLLTMGDVSKMAVIAEVYETDIHKVKRDQVVKIKSKVKEAHTLTGTVVSIGAMVGKNNIYDADPLASVDRRTIKVRILLDQPALAAGLIHHQVYVDFPPP